jgi:flagellar hook-associated protein 3 FlgL
MISSEYSMLSNLANDSATIRNQLSQVQQQVATGLVSQTYSGLGSGAQTSLNLNQEVQNYSTWSANIDAAQGEMGVTQTALTSITSIASSFFAQVSGVNTSDPTSVADLADNAQSALQQVADLLNSKSGNVYVFAGTDSSNPPVPNTDPTVLSTALLASPPTQAPFSTTLTSSVPQVQVGNNQWVSVGLLANANTLATSTPPTSGSYMRDIMTSLASLAGLQSSSNAQSTVSTAQSTLSSGISAISTEAGAFGNIQSSLTTQQTQMTAVSTALTTQLSTVQNVDAASAITQASALQTQLQASYQIIAQSQNLSLASYL